MWELDCEESWAPKNWCFWTVVLENTLESPLDCKEVQPVHPKGDHTRCSMEGLMLKLKLQYFGHLMRRVDSLEKTLMLGQEEKGTTEDKMAGWHHQLYGHEFGWTPGVGDGQGGLVYCNSWGRKESDTTEWLNWTEHKTWVFSLFSVHYALNLKLFLIVLFLTLIPNIVYAHIQILLTFLMMSMYYNGLSLWLRR